MVRYMRVEWHHNHPDEPVLLLSEITAGQETRKVEVGRGGMMGYADELESFGGTLLGEGLIPSVEEVNSSEEFTAREISKEDFEEVWARAHLE
jgi:hypothetical protein